MGNRSTFEFSGKSGHIDGCCNVLGTNLSQINWPEEGQDGKEWPIEGWEKDLEISGEH